MAHQYIYLHGFASSPNSLKADQFKADFAKAGLSLSIPDLNQGDFSHLTLTRQLDQVARLFKSNTPVTLIGSSFGGLTAAWMAQLYPQVEKIILLAPAFGFVSHWLPMIGSEKHQQWQKTGYISVYHYGEKRELPLHYGFIKDLTRYEDSRLTRAVPTAIAHGIHDTIIPITASQNYSATRPWVQLTEFESDHVLDNVLPEIWQIIKTFCQLSV